MTKVLSVLFFILIVFEGIGFSQTRATTEDGRKVILLTDGTWQYSAPTHPGTTEKPHALCLKIDPAESPLLSLPMTIFDCSPGFCVKTSWCDPSTGTIYPIRPEPHMVIPKELKRMQSSKGF
jgi:hypothetical protein